MPNTVRCQHYIKHLYLCALSQAKATMMMCPKLSTSKKFEPNFTNRSETEEDNLDESLNFHNNLSLSIGDHEHYDFHNLSLLLF